MPRNPWAFGGRVPPPSFATHAGIRTSCASTTRFPGRFTRAGTLPYPSLGLDRTGLPVRPSHDEECRSFGAVLEPRYIVGAESLDQ